MQFSRRIRLDRQRYADPSTVFHVVIRLHPRLGVLPPSLMPSLWEALVRKGSPPAVILHAACLMPDHVHLLVAPGSKDLVAWVGAWKSWTTRLYRSSGGRGTLWQPRFWDRAIRDDDDYETTLGYILANPVEAGLAPGTSAWPWVWVWDGAAGRIGGTVGG